MGRFNVGDRVEDWDGDGAVVLRVSGKRIAVAYDNTDNVQDAEFDRSLFTPADDGKGWTVGSVGRDWDNRQGTVTKIGWGQRKLAYDDGGKGWVPVESLAGAWVPKVGDRVRVTGARLDHKEKYIGTEFVIAEQCYEIDDKPSWTGTGVGSYVWTASELEPLPVAQQPAGTETWAPVVGKYGMTRDGRKVGPILERTAAYYPFKCDVDFSEPDRVSTAIWAADGTNYEYRWLDLIAEWPATTEAAAPVADVEATATTFKVGDRVLCVKAYPGAFTVGREYTVAYFDDDERPRLGVTNADHGRPDGIGAEYFTPAPTPTFSPGQLVTLAAPLEVLGTHHAMAHLRIGANSYTLPIEALAAA